MEEERRRRRERVGKSVIGKENDYVYNVKEEKLVTLNKKKTLVPVLRKKKVGKLG